MWGGWGGGVTRDQMWDGTDARLLRACTRSHARCGKLPQCSAQPDTTLVLNANRGQSAEAIRTAAFAVIPSRRRRRGKKRNGPPKD